MQFHDLKVKRVIRETLDAVSLVFEVPKHLKDTFQFIQGQYLTLRFELNGEKVRRAYSMSSSPIESEIKITIKRIVDGLVSSHISKNIKAGSTVAVMSPKGRFYTVLDAENKKSYYLFGGGSGITPLMSILKTVLAKEPLSKVFLLYGNHDETSIIFRTELHHLQKKYKDRLFVEHILSDPIVIEKKTMFGLSKKEIISWKGLVGVPNAQNTLRFLNRNRPHHKKQEYFVCGPTPMMDAVEAVLLGKDIDKKIIHLERFSAAPAPTKNENGKEENIIEVDLSGVKADAVLVAHLGDETIETTIPLGKSILDTLIDLGHEPPFSCKTGACATCLGKCMSGKVKMNECLTLEEDEIEEGLILTCQSRPLTDRVEITYSV